MSENIEDGYTLSFKSSKSDFELLFFNFQKDGWEISHGDLHVDNPDGKEYFIPYLDNCMCSYPNNISRCLKKIWENHQKYVTSYISDEDIQEKFHDLGKYLTFCNENTPEWYSE